MTDSEIIEALCCCSDTATRCDECPYYGKEAVATTCSMFLMQDAYKLIKRQKAEIKKQRATIKNFKATKEMLRGEIEKLKKEVDTWKRVKVILGNDGTEKGVEGK